MTILFNVHVCVGSGRKLGMVDHLANTAWGVSPFSHRIEQTLPSHVSLIVTAQLGRHEKYPRFRMVVRGATTLHLSLASAVALFRQTRHAGASGGRIASRLLWLVAACWWVAPWWWLVALRHGSVALRRRTAACSSHWVIRHGRRGWRELTAWRLHRIWRHRLRLNKNKTYAIKPNCNFSIW